MYTTAAAHAWALMLDDSGYTHLRRALNDANVRPEPQAERSACARFLDGLGAEVLAGPDWAGAPADFATGDRHTFDAVRTSERRGGEVYGVDGTLPEVARGIRLPPRFASAMGSAREALLARASELARRDLKDGTDAYNGYFPRLLMWRVELASRHAGRRLHLLTEETTFFTWRLLHERKNRINAHTDRLFLHRDGDATASIGAAHLPVAVNLFTADGFLVLRRRSALASFAPNQIESAANGNPETRDLPGVRCDRSAGGLLDLAAAARRELAEELGPVPLAGAPRVAGLLFLTSAEEVAVPYLMFEARTELDAGQLKRFFHLADPTEGFHESSGELIALPTSSDTIGQSFHYLDTETELRPLTKAMIVMGLTSRLTEPRAAEVARVDDDSEIRKFYR